MFQQKKPYSAVTVAIDALTSESHEEDDLSGIPELVEAIALQASGPAEAARALRKKLKYGSAHRQLRALALLDGLLHNAGPRAQRALASDEPLLERLRVCGASELADPAVRRRCRELFAAWGGHFAGMAGMERMARLQREVPKRKVMVKQETSRAVRETENPFEEEAAATTTTKPATTPTPATPASSSEKGSGEGASRNIRGAGLSAASALLFGVPPKKKKKPKSKPLEREQIKAAIEEGGAAASSLLDAVQAIDRERERISHNALAVERFEACKLLRRKVLRYIHHVSDEQWLGPLLHANDELVHALMTFEQLDQSVDADSDSDDELAEQAHLYRMVAARGKKEEAERVSAQSAEEPVPDVAGLSIDAGAGPASPRGQRKPPPPPRPAAADDNDNDDDGGDPFADCNTVE